MPKWSGVNYPKAAAIAAKSVKSFDRRRD